MNGEQKFKEVKRAYRYCIDNSEDRTHRDYIVREAWYDNYRVLNELRAWYYLLKLKRKLWKKDNSINIDNGNSKNWIKLYGHEFCRYRKEFDYDCGGCIKEYGYCRFFQTSD